MSSLFFLYGLIFFLVGTAIIIISLTHKTNYLFLDKLVYLGIFIALKGVVEWQHLFCNITDNNGDIAFLSANVLHRLFTLVAILFMSVFGVELLAVNYNRANLLRVVFSVFYIGFIVYFFIYPGYFDRCNDTVAWGLNLEKATTQLVLLPGGLVAALALYLHLELFSKVKITKIYSALLLGVISVYTLLVGFSTSFYPLNGLRVEIIEMVLSVILFLCIVVLAEYLKNQHQINKLKVHDAVILDIERDRIARDMHDGTIQSLYGVSLKLGYVKHLLSQKQPPEELEKNIIYIQNSLGEVIDDVRNYIYNNLAEKYHYENLEQGINHLVSELHNTTDLELCFIYNDISGIELSKEVVLNTYFVVREAILNIVKHANAKHAEIRIEVKHERVYILIKDDGVGINRRNKSSGMGLIAMRTRVEQHLKGHFSILKKSGTILEIDIPIGEENAYDKESIDG